MKELPIWYQPGFVIASVVIAIWASYVAIQLAERMAKSAHPMRWLSGAAFVWATGIWSMHFIAMLAFQTSVWVRYDVVLTVISWLLPNFAAWAGFYLLHRNMPLPAVSVLFGTAIVIMHFTGMEAMHMPAGMEHNLAYVYAAYGVAITASIAALWTAFSGEASRNMRRFAALPLGIAIAGMHYTAMAGLTVWVGTVPHVRDMSFALGREGLGVWVVLSATAIISVGWLIAENEEAR